MMRKIKVDKPEALAVVRDIIQLNDRIEKFHKDQQERYQREHNEFMQAAHKEHIENLDRFRFAAAIPHSLDGWVMDNEYIEFGVVFLVQQPNAERKEQEAAMAEKIITGAQEQ